MAAVAREHSFRKGERIYGEGDPGDALYVIRSGAVDLVDGQGALLDRRDVGAGFGMSTLLRGGDFKNYITAIEDTLVLYLPGDVFRELVAQEPEFETVENTEAVNALLATHDSCAAADEIIKEMDKNEFTLGGIIHDIRLHKAHERIVDGKGKQVYVGSEGFAQYCEQRLKMHHRRAYALADIYVTSRLVGITEEEVAVVGWTKMMSIARVVTDKNKGKLLQFAEKHTVKELDGFITELKKSGNVSTRGANAKSRGGHSFTAIQFNVPGDRAEFCKQAIEMAKDKIREEGKPEPTDSEAFAALCSDYLAMAEAADISFDSMKAMVEARFPGALAASFEKGAEAEVPAKGKGKKK